MQVLVEILSGLIAMLAAAALSQFGVQLDTPKPVEREIERVQTCTVSPAQSVKVQPNSAC